MKTKLVLFLTLIAFATCSAQAPVLPNVTITVALQGGNTYTMALSQQSIAALTSRATAGSYTDVGDLITKHIAGALVAPAVTEYGTGPLTASGISASMALSRICAPATSPAVAVLANSAGTITVVHP